MLPERISDAEYAVMDVLWQESPLTASDVIARAPASRKWSAQTVKTLLSRLVTKGVAATQADGRRFLYTPLVEREAYVASESRRLIDRLFDGKVSPLVAHLAERQSLTDKDIAEIEALLKALKS